MQFSVRIITTASVFIYEFTQNINKMKKKTYFFYEMFNRSRINAEIIVCLLKSVSITLNRLALLRDFKYDNENRNVQNIHIICA